MSEGIHRLGPEFLKLKFGDVLLQFQVIRENNFCIEEKLRWPVYEVDHKQLAPRWNDFVCRGEPTNQNKFGGKSLGDQYIGGPPRF